MKLTRIFDNNKRSHEHVVAICYKNIHRAIVMSLSPKILNSLVRKNQKAKMKFSDDAHHISEQTMCNQIFKNPVLNDAAEGSEP